MKAIASRITRNRPLKKSLRIILVLLILLAAVFFLWPSLQKRRPTDLEIPYTVSIPDIPESLSDEVPSLWIMFQGSAAPLELIGKELDLNIPIKPPIAGSWYWEDESNLRFTPEQHWPIGTSYKITLLDALIAEHIEVESTASFSTPTLTLQFTDSSFMIDPQDSRTKWVQASILSNYPLEQNGIKEKISLAPDLKADNGNLENRPYDFSLSFSEDVKTMYIVSEPLGVPADDVNMIFTLGKGIRSSWSGEASSTEERQETIVYGASKYVKVNELFHHLIPNDDQGFVQVLSISTRGRVAMDELQHNLSAFLLPQNRPELPGIPESPDHYWNSPDEVLPEVLKLASSVNLHAIPNEQNESAFNSFRFQSETGRFIYIKLKAGTRFYGNYYLKEDYEDIIQVKQYPKELNILSEGAILAMSGDKKISIMSRGIKDVRFRIGRIRPDDINHLVSQSNGNLEDFYFRGYRFDEYNITEQYETRKTISITDVSKPAYLSFDFSTYLKRIPDKNLRYGLFILTISNREDSEWYEDKRLIMVSDLGIYAKTSRDGVKDVFIQSLSTGAPLPGIKVKVLGMNGNPVASGSTDAGGHLKLPGLGHLKNDNEPVAYVATRGEDMAFLPYQSSYLDYSDFNVGGVRGSSDPKSLKAFLFSDRGIYRPGDEVRMGFIVKSGDWTRDISGTPLEFQVSDSQGTIIHTEKMRLDSSGFKEVRFSTQEYSPTGSYTASLYLLIEEYKQIKRMHLGSENIDVEEFLPDNLNISASFFPLPSQGWIDMDSLKARVHVRNLFGTAAAGNRVIADITLSPAYRIFPGFEDYQFFDPYLKDNRYNEPLGEDITDDEGFTEFSIDLSGFEPASYNIRLDSTAFEKGSGRSVGYSTSAFISPLRYIVGLKANGRTDYINKDSERTVQFIALDSSLESIAVPDMMLEIHEIRYVSTLVLQPNGTYKYESVKRDELKDTRPIAIIPGGTELMLPTDAAGEYTLYIKGNDGLEYSRFSFSVKGEKNIERSLDKNAELEISLNSKDYNNGERVEIFIKAPYAGAGLITIEQDKVYAYKWFQSQGKSSTQSITVPPDIEGNGYINATFLRALDSPEIFMSPLSYGSVPFSVSREKQTNHIRLEIPDTAKPGKDFPISYSTSRPGKIIVFAVDEGILQAGDYSTPDPLSFYLRKKALEVQTSQILSLLLPEFSIVQTLAATGGGFDETAYLERNLNPFRRKRVEPVAYWSGILDTDSRKQIINYRIPDYFNGTLRVMAVAVSPDALGTAEKKATIQDTFIIKPNGPLAAAPGDEFEVSVTVANNQKNSGGNASVLLEAEVSEGLEILSGESELLQIPESRDGLAILKLRAKDVLGEANIVLRASANGEESTYSNSMSIRPATPYITTLVSGVVNKESVKIAMPRKVREEFAEHEISLSYLPLGLARGLHFYLSKYPYGCTEQIVSSTFPLLYPTLTEELELSGEESSDKVKTSLSILQSRQKRDGGMGLWTAKSSSHPIIDAYSALFLTRSELQGFYVPESMKLSLIRRMEEIAASSGQSLDELRQRAFAIYVLTMQQQVSTSYIESLDEDLKEYEKDWESDFIGLFLAGSYAMLQQDGLASKLLRKIKWQQPAVTEGLYLDNLAYSAFYLQILTAHFPERLQDAREDLLISIAKQMEGSNYTTLSASLTLMAIDSYLKAVPDAEEGRFTIRQTSRDGSESELKAEGEKLYIADLSPDAAEVELRNEDRLNLFYQTLRAGFDRQLPQEKQSTGIEVHREYRNSDSRKSDEFSLGETISAVVKIRALEKQIVEQVAVVDILPAGFEADIASIRHNQSGGWQPDYVDIREDRIIIFGDITTDLHEFSYQLKPIARGRFITPPIYAEAMYDPAIRAISPASPVTVR